MSNGTRESSLSSNPENYEELRHRITLSNSELYEMLGCPEKFSERIALLNEEGIEKVLEQQLDEAMVYFSEAERDLEYMASCGDDINRVLITTTLKNKASVHQRLWELAPSSDYMEALLFHLQSYLETEPNIEVTSEIKNKKSASFHQFSKFINRRIFIGLCQLQNAALISQTGDHVSAKKSAECSLQHFKLSCLNLFKYEKTVKGKNSELLQNLTKNCIINEKGGKIDRMMKRTKNNLLKLKRHRHFFNFATETISELSIGDVMQIGHMSVDKAQKNIDPDYYISQIGIIYLAMYIGCAHFVIAAQTRLINQEKYGDTLKKSTREYIQSQISHLHSISLIAGVVMLESHLLNHLMKSFKNHYGIDLEYEDAYFEEMSSIEGVSQRTNNQIQLQIFDELNRQQITAETQEVCGISENQIKLFLNKERSSQDMMKASVCHKPCFKTGSSQQLIKKCSCCEHTVESTPSNIKRIVKGRKSISPNEDHLLKTERKSSREKKENKLLLTFRGTCPVKEEKTSRSKNSIKSQGKKKFTLTKIKSTENLKERKEVLGEYYRKDFKKTKNRGNEEKLRLSQKKFLKVQSPRHAINSKSKEKSKSKKILMSRKNI